MRRSSKFLNIVLLLTVIAVPFSCAHQENRSHLIQVEPEDSFEEIVRKSTLVVPSERQYDWQQLEFIAFLHFGPNTFTGVEWGTGMEDPAVFNPTNFDATQWISVIKDAGMKLAMLTAKHHDGFCLWPTTTTDHSVKNSPWKNGKGDVMGELVEAAHAENIEIGVYLSPADLHEIERPNGTYGNGSEPKLLKIPSDPELQKSADQVFEYELDDYDALFMNQLYEVLTQYGPIEEVWFDGANPKPGTGQTYNREAWYDMIRKLQPGAVIAIKGPDVRWCGNEAGITRESEWSVVPVPEHPDNFEWPTIIRLEDLGSRDKLKNAKYLYWYPAETNTSIRHGWFYRDDEQYVKTVEELVDTWYRTVGGNTVFLLNLTPDRRGLIPEKDAERLRAVGRIIAASFKENLALNAAVEASDAETSPENILDGNVETFWKPAEENEQAELILTLEGEKEFNRLVLQECIKTQGQRIERFAFDVWENNDWKEIGDGTVVGYKNIRRFPMVKTEKIRLRILQSRVAPAIATFGLYKAPETLSNPSIFRNKECKVSIRCQTPDPAIHYTLDGSEPDAESPVYENPIELPDGGIVKAIAMINNGAQRSEVVEARFDICPADWTIEEVSAQHTSYPVQNVIDGDPSTMWHTPWGSEASGHPHFVTINFGEILSLKGFSYLPRTDGQLGGVCQRYKIEVSENGTNWKLVKQGTFDNIKNNPAKQEILFGKPIDSRYLRFTCLTDVDSTETLSVAEIGVITHN